MDVLSLKPSTVFLTESGQLLIVSVVDAHQVPLSKRIDSTSLAGVIYAKPNVMNNPPVACKFYPVPGAVANYTTIYTTAADHQPGGVTPRDAYHTGWPNGVNQHKFDLDLIGFGFKRGDYVAIAFNIDNQVNNNGLEYSFSCGANVFSPAASIMEGNDTDALSWVASDDFQSGVIQGAKTPIGKTIVFVCRVVTASAPGKFVSFNLNVRSVDPNNTSYDTDTAFDPKIKNDG